MPIPNGQQPLRLKRPAGYERLVTISLRNGNLLAGPLSRQVAADEIVTSWKERSMG